MLSRVALGEDPAAEKQSHRNKISVAELCDRYLEEGTITKKPSTIATDKGRIERHIKPLLGRKKAADVTRGDIQRFLQDVANGKTATDVRTGLRGRAIVKGGRGTATRTLGLLGGIFSYALDCGLVETNPVQGVRRFKENRNERYLSEQELVRLGSSLRQATEDGLNPLGLCVIKLLVFTGARKNEIASLKWSEVDLQSGYLRLEDSKTGRKAIPLNAPAAQLLAEWPRVAGSPYVFPASSGAGHYQGTPKVWQKVRGRAGLNDVRLHDLRHSFASIAVSGGASLPMIGSLLGHASTATTQRYTHLHDDPVRAASESAGRKIAERLLGEPSALKIVNLRSET